MSGNLSIYLLILGALALVELGQTDERCRDLYPLNCRKWKQQGYCQVAKYRPTMQRKCRESCSLCSETECVDLVSGSQCAEWLNQGLCDEGKIAQICSATCRACHTDTVQNCPVLKIKHGRFERNDKRTAVASEAQPTTDIHSVTQPGDTVSFVCKPGFQLRGNSTVTCQDNGKYNWRLGVCVRNDECQVPKYDISYEGLDRYYLVSQEMDDNNIVPPGTFAILVCQNGRKLQSFCSGFGQWLPPMLECTDETAKWDRWYPDEDNMSKRHLDWTIAV